MTGHALNEKHLLTSRAFREGVDKGQRAATASTFNASDTTHSTAAARLPIPDGLLEVELSSTLRFTEDDRLHEVLPQLLQDCTYPRASPQN